MMASRFKVSKTLTNAPKNVSPGPTSSSCHNCAEKGLREALEAHQDFEIQTDKGSFFSPSWTQIKTGRDTTLLLAKQKSPRRLNFYSLDWKPVWHIYDKASKLLLSVERSRLSGYLSTRLVYQVVQRGIVLGEVARVEEMMAKGPKYTIEDCEGNPLFQFQVIQKGQNSKTSISIMGKYGKTGTVELDKDKRNLKLRLYHFCTVPEKALILCFLLILSGLK